MLGPGEPNSGPSGCPPVSSAGRSARHAFEGGIWTPGARFGSWRGSSSTVGATNGSVGISGGAFLSGLVAVGEEQAVDERVVQSLPRRLDDVVADPDGGPVPLAVGGIDEHAGDGPGPLARVEDADLVVGEV